MEISWPLVSFVVVVGVIYYCVHFLQKLGKIHPDTLSLSALGFWIGIIGGVIGGMIGGIIGTILIGSWFWINSGYDFKILYIETVSALFMYSVLGAAVGTNVGAIIGTVAGGVRTGMQWIVIGGVSVAFGLGWGNGMEMGIIGGVIGSIAGAFAAVSVWVVIDKNLERPSINWAMAYYLVSFVLIVGVTATMIRNLGIEFPFSDF